jgi:acyl carrier protein
MPTIRERVIKIISKQLSMKESDVALEAHLMNDLGADSLDCVEIVMALEDEFAVEFLDKDIKDIVIVSELIRFIEDAAK